MATTACSKTFCFRTNWQRRLLKIIGIASLILVGVIFAVKTHKKLAKLSHQFDSLNIQYYDVQSYLVQISHLTHQIEILKSQINIHKEREIANVLEAKSIQAKYQGEVDRMTLIVQQYEARVRELSDRFISLQHTNSQLTERLNLFQFQTFEVLKEVEVKSDKIGDSSFLRKEIETFFQEFLRKEISNLLQAKSVNSIQEEISSYNERKIHGVHVPDFKDPFDTEQGGKNNDHIILIGDKASVTNNKVDSANSFYVEEMQEPVKTEHLGSDKKYDWKDTSYRFTHKGLRDSIINEVNFSDPFDTEEVRDSIKTEYSGSNKVRDWIDTSYRLTKESFEAVKDYVNEKGPKIADEVQKVSKKKAKEINEYVSEAIPKVSKKIKDFSEKTKEITGKVGSNMKKQAEKLANEAIRLTESIYNIMRP